MSRTLVGVLVAVVLVMVAVALVTVAVVLVVRRQRYIRPPGTRRHGIRIEGTVVRFLTSSPDTQMLGFCADLAHDFFARVPSSGWQNLRGQPPRCRPTAIPAVTA